MNSSAPHCVSRDTRPVAVASSSGSILADRSAPGSPGSNCQQAIRAFTRRDFAPTGAWITTTRISASSSPCSRRGPTPLAASSPLRWRASGLVPYDRLRMPQPCASPLPLCVATASRGHPRRPWELCRMGPHRLHRLRGPPTHIRLLRQLCVEQRGWMDAGALRGRRRDVQPAARARRPRSWPSSAPGGSADGAARWSVGPRSSCPGCWPSCAVGAVSRVGAAALGARRRRRCRRRGGRRRRQAAARCFPTAGARRVSALRFAVYLIAGASRRRRSGPWLVLVLLGCGLLELVARAREPAGRRMACRACRFSPRVRPRPVACSPCAGWRSRSVRCPTAAGS